MPYVPPGEESLKEDGWYNAPSPIIGPSGPNTGPHYPDGSMPTVPTPRPIDTGSGGSTGGGSASSIWDLFGGLF